jgi:hypothetical protein
MTDAVDPQSDLVRVRYPDPLFRPIPPFSMDVPPDWLISEFPDSLFVMGPEADESELWSNVLVRHSRVFPTTSFEHIGVSSWAELQAIYPDVEVTDQRMITGQVEHYVREVELDYPDVGRVTRVDSFAFGPATDQPTRDLFQITWLNPQHWSTEIQHLYFKMLLSFQFD